MCLLHSREDFRKLSLAGIGVRMPGRTSLPHKASADEAVLCKNTKECSPSARTNQDQYRIAEKIFVALNHLNHLNFPASRFQTLQKLRHRLLATLGMRTNGLEPASCRKKTENARAGRSEGLREKMKRQSPPARNLSAGSQQFGSNT